MNKKSSENNKENERQVKDYRKPCKGKVKVFVHCFIKLQTRLFRRTNQRNINKFQRFNHVLNRLFILLKMRGFYMTTDKRLYQHIFQEW